MDFNRSDTGVEILTESSVLDRMNSFVKQLQEAIDRPSAICQLLLRDSNWDTGVAEQRFFDADERVPVTLCGSYKPDDPNANSDGTFYSATNRCCVLCDNEDIKVYGLNCGHLFCVDCWNSYVRQKVVGDLTSRITCPYAGCNVLIDKNMIRRMCCNEAILQSFERLEVRDFVLSSDRIISCPADDCNNYAATASSWRCFKIVCPCGKTYCSLCCKDWHEPVSCEMIVTWNSRFMEDKANMKWLKAFTKPCPRCKTLIEKNQGCNHMSCRSAGCRYEFCWVCGGSWREHNRGSPYDCNRYQGERVKSHAGSELERFNHYASRYDNHRQSIRFERKLREQLDQKICRFQDMGFSYAEATFIEEALDVLIDSRRILQHTYVFAYYLDPIKNTTKIFEDNQRFLEHPTEHLSELLEQKDITRMTKEQLKRLKSEIQDVTRYLKRRCSILLQSTYEGTKKGDWAYSIQTASGTMAR